MRGHTNQSIYGSNEPCHTRESIVIPSTPILYRAKYLRSRNLRGQHPKWDQNSKETKTVHNQNNTLYQGKLLGQECVKHQGYQSHRNDEQRDMPWLIGIRVRVVYRNHTNHHVSDCVTASCDTGVPTQHTNPSSNVTQ